MCGKYYGLVQFKTKMQIQIIRSKSGAAAVPGTVSYRNVFHAGYVIISTYGFRSAYQGVTGTLLRNIPANGIYFGINYYLLEKFKKNPQYYHVCRH